MNVLLKFSLHFESPETKAFSLCALWWTDAMMGCHCWSLELEESQTKDLPSLLSLRGQKHTNLPRFLTFLPPYCTGCLWYLQYVCLTLFWAVCHIFYIFLHPVFAQLDWLNFIVITCTSRGDRKHLASDRKCSSRWLLTSFFHIITVRFFILIWI